MTKHANDNAMPNKENGTNTPTSLEALHAIEAILAEVGVDDQTQKRLHAAYRDVTKSIEAQEKQLSEAKFLAEQAIRSKADFLSRISHEVRTPINAISGMMHIAQGADDIERVKECLGVISNSSMDLLAIVNDVLDMSAMGSGGMQLSDEPFSFESMLMKIAGKLSVKTEEKGQKLYCNIDVGMPTHFMGDEQRLTQVIFNLLSNAVKFTPEGGAISITARQIEREGDQSTIEVLVSDNGIGISKADQAKLFQAFYQSDGSTARQYSGTGLGLAIVQQLVEMMHGEIFVKSEVDRGSTFRFTAKLTVITDAEPQKAKEKDNVRGMNVLIVDPDAETQEYFCEIMGSFKVHGQAAPSIEAAMSLIEQGRKSKEPVSILFLDWSLAERDGVSIAQTLKRQYSVSTVAMLPMTQMGENMLGDAADTGMSYIAKPLFPSVLLRSIYEIAGTPIQQEGATNRARCSFSGYHVLLVEDVEINRRIFDQIMVGTQVAISHAENGAIAVEMFVKNPEKYDIILMDIHMPVMDGYEATRMIRNLPMPQAKSVPIVAVTANAFAADIELSAQAGMNGHLTKPIEVDTLFDVMGHMLHLDENEEERQKKAAQAALEVEIATNAAHERLRQIKVLDYDGALSRVRGSVRVLKILLQSFASNNQFAQLKEEVAEGDYERAARTAQAIRGTCANLSLVPLQEKIAELEMQLQSRFHIEETVAEVDRLFADTLEGIKEALQVMGQIVKG